MRTAAESARHASGERARRPRPPERVDPLQREEGEEQRQVVGEQREGGAEEVGRQREHERERQRLPRLERRGAAEQPEQRERGAVRDRRVQQPELPELEARDLAEAGEQQVVERGLRRRIGAQVHVLGELPDRGQVVEPGVRAVEGVDLDGEALQRRDGDEEGDGEHGRGQQAPGGAHAAARRRRPSGHMRRSGHSAQRGARAAQVRRPWRMSSMCTS